MKNILLFLLFVAVSGSACAQRFEVTAGDIQRYSKNNFLVTASEMRAVVPESTSESVTTNFVYFGPTAQVSHLQNGEVRHQFGLKLRAQDICNLVYVMWDFDSQIIRVSVKLNPGERTSQECKDHGYHGDFVPVIKEAPPVVKIGASHQLYAGLAGQTLTVVTDGITVWQGILPPVVLDLHGPPGIRSDNAQILFDYDTMDR